MDNFYKSKWFVRIISLAFAVLLYVFVNIEANTTQKDPRYTPSGSEEMETVEDMPVNIRIDDQKYVVSGVPETVSVSLEGNASILRPTAIQKKFEVYVDLRKYGEGEHSVEIEHGDLPKGLKAYIEPKTIDVTIEERDSKVFEVKADFINEEQLPAGYELGKFKIEPSTVKLTSSKSVIEQIALVKVFVDVKDLKEPINKREVPVNVYDNKGNELNVRIEPENVVVSVDIHNPSKKVSVKVPTKGQLPKDYTLKSIDPDEPEIEVYAKSDKLGDLKEITTEEVDLSKIKESGQINVNLKLPDNTEAATESVPVTVELEQTKRIKNVPITINNIPTGKDVRIKGVNGSSVELEIVGNERDVRELDVDDFKVSIDVGGLEPGQHRVPLTITGPENVKATSKDQDVLVEIM